MYIEKQYRELEIEVFRELGINTWNLIPNVDRIVYVKSHQTLWKYDDIKFFKEKEATIEEVKYELNKKTETVAVLKKFLKNNGYKEHVLYSRIVEKTNTNIHNGGAYRIRVIYISRTGRVCDSKIISIKNQRLRELEENPSLLMSKGEYNKQIREQQKEAVAQKQREFYERVNEIIDYANKYKETLFIRGGAKRTDELPS